MNKAEKMYEIVSGFDGSGQDRRSYCAQHEISVSRFAYWRSKWLRLSRSEEESTSTSPGNFVAIEPLASPSALASGCELVYPNGLRLHLAQVDIKVLTSLIEAYV